MCSSLPASGTSAWDPSVGACLLTSPEVTCRAVTHSTSAPTCPRSCPEPPSPGQGEGTGQPVLGAWILLAMGPRFWALSGRWVAALASAAPWRPVAAPVSCTHRPGKETINFCNEVSTPAAGVLPDKPVEQLSVLPTDPPSRQGVYLLERETEAGSQTATDPNPCWSFLPP